MKLPAYAHALLKARRAGAHPPLVTVIYGNDWYAEPGTARLALKPGEALGRDWRCVAGLPVEFVNRSACLMFEEDDCEPLRVIGEIAIESAQIWMIEDGMRVSADTWAYMMRSHNGAACQWPAWWSEEIEKNHGQNRKRWISEAASYLARFAA